MINTNYSRNTPLLDYEIYDFDTTDNYSTGINDGRMRLPTRYDISKFYKQFKNNKEYILQISFNKKENVSIVHYR